MSDREPTDPRVIDADARRHGEAHRAPHASSSLTSQWTALLLAPTVFFTHLQIAYVLVPWSCASGNHVWLHVVGALSVLLALVGTAVGWMVWDREGRGHPGEHGGPAPRARFLGVTGAVTSATFALLLAGQWAAAFILSPCQ